MLSTIYKFIISACLSAVLCSPIFSQGTHRAQIGITVGHGSQFGLDLGYTYRVELFLLEYKLALVDWAPWKIKTIVSPQFNLARFKDRKELERSDFTIEYGVNVAMILQYSFSNTIAIYAGLASGPHYVSDMPDRQSPGFIFSDHILGGFEIRLGYRTNFETRFAFRHMSNAGIKQPNGGVNNNVLFLGLNRFL